MVIKRLTAAALTLAFLSAPYPALAQAERDAAQKQYEYAYGLLSLGIYYEAAREFGVFTKQFPTHDKAGAAAYYRAKAFYEYGTSPQIRAAAREAVAAFHRDYPDHPARNLGSFLLGEIAMDEALELEREIGARERDEQPTAELEARFEAACEEAYPNYRKFIELTDLAKITDARTREDMTWRVVTARHNIAQCLLGLKRWEEAIDEYRVLVDDPAFTEWGRDEAQYLIGQAYFEWGKRLKGSLRNEKLAQALDEYKRVMFYGLGLGGRSEFSDDARLGEAWCLYELTRYSECRKLLEGSEAYFKQVYEQFKANPNKLDERWVRSLWPEIIYLYGKSFYEDGRFEEAIKRFERVMNMGGDNPWKAEATRMYDACAKQIGSRFGKQIKLASADDAVRAYKVAENKHLAGRHEDAIADFERIWNGFAEVRTWSYRDTLLYYWGKSLYASGADGRLLEAAAVFNYLAKTGNPRAEVVDDRQPAGQQRRVSLVGDASFWEGSSYWRLGEEMDEGDERDAITEAAILAFERLAERTPEHPKAPERLLNVGHFYLREKQYLRAGQAYRRMVTLYPRHEDAPKALLNLCYVYRELGQFNEVIWAAGIFEKNFPKRPDVVPAIDLKGYAWFKLAQAADEPRQEMEFYRNAAAEYGKLKAEAFPWLSDLQREEEYGTIFANALFYAAYSYERIGETAKALDRYRLFLERAPHDNTHLAEGRVRAAELHLEGAHYAEAVETLRPSADALDEPDPTAHRGIGTLVAALLKLADTETDPAAKDALRDEAVSRAKHFYSVYAATPIHHGSYVTIAEAFKEAELFDAMLDAYTKLMPNQRLHFRTEGLTSSEKRALYGVYTRLLYEAGTACAEAADVLEAREEPTKKFDVAAADFLDEHLRRARKLLGPGRIPADYVDVYFSIAKILKRAGEPAKGAKALEKIAAVVPETDPRFLKAYYERGNIWLESGYPKRSLASYIYVIDWADPDNPERAKYIALSYYQAGIAQFRVADDAEAKAKSKKLFETLISTFGGSEDETIRKIVARGREELAKIEKELGTGGGN